MSTLPQRPKTLLLLCGGFSLEHDISITSARFIAEQVDQSQYTVLVVIVGQDRQWIHVPYESFMGGDRNGLSVHLIRQKGESWLMGDGFAQVIDIVFPAIHGTGGEDGSIQGLLEYMNLPYVGNGVLASAVTMDKIVTKQILLAHNLPVVPFLILSHSDPIPTYEEACQALGTTVLILKPSISGSSVGVAKVENDHDYRISIKNAFAYSTRILIETAMTGSEVECAILGNEKAIASGVGEIIVHNVDKIYSYEAKYHDREEKQAQVYTQAITIDAPTQERVRAMALQAFHALTCSGLARVDFFVTPQGIFINEINTIPGFTAISLYPKLWECRGIHPKELISRLLQYGQDRFNQNAQLVRHYQQP